MSWSVITKTPIGFKDLAASPIKAHAPDEAPTTQVLHFMSLPIYFTEATSWSPTDKSTKSKIRAICAIDRFLYRLGAAIINVHNKTGMRNCVEVQPTTILFPNTYISSLNRFTFQIHNHSDERITYEWRIREDSEEERKIVEGFDLSNPAQRDESETVLQYHSKIFHFETLRGEIWPHGLAYGVADFTPELSNHYTDTAYLYIKETDERIAVTLQGGGLAPEAQFSVQSVSVGHLPVETTMDYQVSLVNIGKAVVEWELEPKETPGLVFEFSPTHGTIPVGSSAPIDVKFVANSVCSFSETFLVHIKGSTICIPSVSFYGKIMGPTFILSETELDFGVCSFGFMYRKTLEIENKSDIPFDYTFRLGHDGTFLRREFSVRPCKGTLDKFEKQEILIEFIPDLIQDYDVKLCLDIAKYGESLSVVPIKAKCLAPEIEVPVTDINLGSVFVGYPYEASLEMIDNTPYPAKFEYLPSNDITQLEAKTVVPEPNGIIPAHGRATLNMTVTPSQLGPLNVKHYLRFYGNEHPPMIFTVSGTCVGPKIVLNRNEIDYGKIQALQKIRQVVEVTNDSVISSHFTSKIEDENGVFFCENEEGEIKPGETMPISVIARLDDTVPFTARLVLFFQYLNPMYIPLKATGTGSCVVSSIAMDTIELGYIFTERPVINTFILHNQGRRKQEVRWTGQKPKVDGPSNANVTVKMVPEIVVLPPRSSSEVQLVVQSNVPCSFQTEGQWSSSLAKRRGDLFTPVITGTFIKPVLTFNKQTVAFKHLHNIEAEEQATGHIQSKSTVVPYQDLLQVLTEELTITNMSKIQLVMTFDCPAPFSFSEPFFALDPGASQTFTVSFDPSFKKDFISEVVNKKLTVSFKGHPMKMYVNLKGEIVFPNVSFSPSQSVDFGIMLMNTEQTTDVVIKNTTELPVDIFWELIADKGQREEAESTKIFDIYPIRMHVNPFEEDVVRVSFFALADSEGRSATYKGTAVCHVVGGPEYTIQLSGAAAAIQYKIDPLHFEFGNRSYKDSIKEKMTLENLSDVPIKYTIMIPKQCKFNTFDIRPMEGVVEVGKSVDFSLQIAMGLPLKYSESFFLQIGHFDEVRIDVNVNCFIPQLQFDLPRHEDDEVMMAWNEPLSRRSQMKRRSSRRGVFTDSDDESISMRAPTPDELSQLEKDMFIRRLRDRSQVSQHSFQRRTVARDSLLTYEGHIASRYVLDLGKIVFGKTFVSEFKIRAISPFPISFDIFDECLTGTGFSVEPKSVRDFPPGEELTITVTFDTKKRENDLIGDVIYELPVVLSEEMASMLYIRAFFEMPVLRFSQTHCDFGSIIVGQSLIVTVQLQNMNNVPCKFKFGDAQSMNVLHRGASSSLAGVFTATPSSGVLPPASFQNVEITFAPTAERNYAMQFPIHIKHNTQPSYVTLRGSGVQLKVVFDPPELVLPPLNPFSDPTTLSVKMINPTSYPIEVLSNQFDGKLLMEKLMEEQGIKATTSTEDLDELIQFGQSHNANSVSKFALCIIVHGAQNSGKTTVSKDISKYLNGMPIIELKDVWKDSLENPDAVQDDFVSAFNEYISQPQYSEGFIIDGLDCLPEPSETEQFIQHCLKQKNIEAELAKEPFTVLQHQHLTAAELALSYILAGLDGHYVFLVGLKATEGTLTDRQLALQEQRERKRRMEKSQEKKRLMQMSEEQYQEMGEDEQEKTDCKRTEIRNRIVETALRDLEAESGKGKRNRANSRSSQGQRGTAVAKKPAKKPNDDPRKDKRRNSVDQESAPRRRSRFSLASADPMIKSMLKFQFTIGSLAQKVREGGETFQMIDPIKLLHESTEVSQAPSEAVIVRKEEESVSDEQRVKRRLATPMPGSRDCREEVQIVFTNENTIIISVVGTREEIESEVCKFIPQLNHLKEKAFTKLIPKPQHVYSASCFQKPQLEDIPTYFSIVVDDPNEVMAIFAESRPATPLNKKLPTGRKSRFGKKGKGQSVVIPDDIDITKRTQRWSIDPNSERILTIRFEAQLIGSYSDVLTFNIRDAKSDAFQLPVSGICAYPDFDRNFATWFPKCVRKMDNSQKSVYVFDANEFNFGSILVVKDRPQKTPAFYRQAITLHNTSLFPAEVTAVCADAGTRSPWYIEKPAFTIPPEGVYEFVVGVHPVVPDVYRTKLTFFVKDQPEIVSIGLAAEGCVPTIETSTQFLDFGKMLLNHTKTLDLELTNIGKLPVYWRFKNVSGLGPAFEFSSTEGLLKGHCTISCTYTSAKPLAIKKAFQIEVLDADKERVFSNVTIQVEAETFDVSFDFQFPKGLDHLQFGALRVGQSKMITCLLKNKGKYPSQFKIAVANQRLLKLLKIKPLEGTFSPTDKPQQIQFIFTSQGLVKFSNAKGISLRITDPMTNTITADFPIPFSVETAFSSFSFEPENAIDFGPTPVNVPVTRQIKITNKGVFPFEFDIKPKGAPVIPRDETMSPETKRGRKSPQRQLTSPKIKGKRNEKPIIIGNFQAIPCTATISPGNSISVELRYLSAVGGHSSCTAMFKISDSNPNDYPEGFVTEFSGDSYVPGIETSDFARIFPNVKRCLRFDLEKDGEATAFLEDDHVLHFAPLILQRRSSAQLVLINPQPIPVTVDLNILPTGKAAKQSKVGFPFEIAEKTVDIEPSGSTCVDISFLPVTMETSTAMVEATVRTGTIEETKMLRFGIEGTGTLPSICGFGGGDGKSAFKGTTSINLGRTLVGLSKEKVVSIKNDGLIDAQISLTIRSSPDFRVKDMDTSKEIIIPPGELINLRVFFVPERPRRSVLDIAVSVADNPKANLGFTITGEAFAEDVMLDGLSDEDQSLMFKDNIVGRRQEAKFVMRNVSDSDIRFTWPTHNDFTFTPRIGHLRKGKTKEITVSFFTEKPTRHNGIRFACQWNKIKYDEINPPDWDDSNKIIKFVTRGSLSPKQDSRKEMTSRRGARKQLTSRKSSRRKEEPQHNPADDEIVKVVEVYPEPPHQVLPGKWKDLQLKVNAVSDIIKYTMDVRDVEFSPTMMYQTRVVECKITNTCQIRFDYRWIINDFIALRGEYPKECGVPFSVQPSSGFISAGRSTVFRVSFHPEEVDDFRATLLCDIHYLAQMDPPQIRVSGFSRRPLCYFNAVISDYISSGRRHPDYTNPLPDNVKVIEIFSQGIGMRATKRFAIMNPTSTSYDISWQVVYDTSKGQLTCDTPQGFVSSGRKHFASFTYIPTSFKTVEAFYQFKILDHNIQVPVLIVGRIMPT